MIEVTNLTKRYGDLLALDQVSFNVQEGEILGFLGPNGAGKTTTMRILTGYMPPSEGSATIAGFDVFEDSLAVRRRVGYLPETVPLYREMTVHDYLDFFATVRGVSNREPAIRRVLESCDIGGVRDRSIGKLSKGYRQRVGLAQALVHDPEVLVLDEPTIGLDPRQILGVRDLIRGLAGQRTVLLSSHILPEVSQLCQRVLIINHGHIVAEDSPERLTSGLQSGLALRLEVARAPEGAAALLEQLPGVRSVDALAPNQFQVNCAPGADARADITTLVVQAGWGLQEVRALSLSLEDIFLQLTTDEAAPEEDASDGATLEPEADDPANVEDVQP
ncbi:MAG: ABC transporter ATP-binding protein [Chloroflexi bacterium]|nr:ABC transporter ATP-binding protein [Chloroflexota bacterium]